MLRRGEKGPSSMRAGPQEAKSHTCPWLKGPTDGAGPREPCSVAKAGRKQGSRASALGLVSGGICGPSQEKQAAAGAGPARDRDRKDPEPKDPLS